MKVRMQLEVKVPPQNLVMAIKIFAFLDVHRGYRKCYIANGIYIPLELQLKDILYTLWSIIIHQGVTVNSGHYWAYTRSAACPTTWLKCNDSTVVVLQKETAPLFGNDTKR